MPLRATRLSTRARTASRSRSRFASTVGTRRMWRSTRSPVRWLSRETSGNAIALEDLGFDIADTRGDCSDRTWCLLGQGADGKHYGLPTERQLQEPGLVSESCFRCRGVRGSDHLGRDDRVERSDRCRWCVRRGASVSVATRRPVGRPPTGWKTSCCGRPGPEKYDQWVSHELPFSSPEVTRAAELLGQVAFTEGYVLGGASSIPSIDFRDAPDPMFNDTTQLLPASAGDVHHQLLQSLSAMRRVRAVWWPVRTTPSFAFPDIDPGKKGALGAGEMAAIFRDGPEVREFLNDFIAADVQCAQGAIEGVARISPNVNVGLSATGTRSSASAAGGHHRGPEGGRFPVRCFGPDAVGSRFGFVLDRHDRLHDRRTGQPRWRPRGHRRQLACLVGENATTKEEGRP